MKRAIITHFDGDPFTLNMWLTLYEKHWRGECDAVYLSVCVDDKQVPDEVERYMMHRIEKFPEITGFFFREKMVPEKANQLLLKHVKEPLVGFIESDGLVYQSNTIAQCFYLLEHGEDIVAPHWDLIDEPYFNGDLQSKGFMRCFFFTKMELLKEIDIDFLPRKIPADTRLNEGYQTGKEVVLDCFGWISWQLLLLTTKITYVPSNVLTPHNIMSPYSNFKWVHVRQMSSSLLGLGGGEFDMWLLGDREAILERVLALFNEELPSGPAEFVHIKALAFKLLFLDMFTEEIGEFQKEYEQVLMMVMEYYNFPKSKVYEIKGFYRGLFEL